VKIRRLTDTGEWTTRRYLSLLGNILIWIIVAIDGWYMWPTQLGGDTAIVVVSGHSMEPTFFGGDLVIARKMEPSVGDVIVYAPEGLGGSQIVHRIIGGTADEGWQMQGDNNNFVDPFTPHGAEVRGVVLVHYSNFGRVTVLLLNPMVWAFVLLAAMVLMLWYTGDDCDDTDDDDGEKKDLGNDEGDPESEGEEEPDLIDRVVEGTEAAVSRMVASGAATGAAALTRLTSRARGLRPVSLVPLRVSALLAVVGLLALSSVSPASASQLTVNVAGQASVSTDQKCATQTLASTVAGTATAGTYTQMSLAGISSGCQSPHLLTAFVHLADGTTKQSVAAAAADSSMVVSVPGGYDAAQVVKVVVSIDGWLFVASWAYTPPPPVPEATCEAINNGNHVSSNYTCSVTIAPNKDAPWGYDNGTKLWNYTFDVAWTNHPPNPNWSWRVTIDQSQAPFPGFTPQWVGAYSNPGITLSSGYSCSGQLPVVQFTSTDYTVSGASIEIADRSAPSGFGGTSFCN